MLSKEHPEKKNSLSGIGWVTVLVCLPTRYFPTATAEMEWN